jgi:type IX secretion system PorP/SprF family membrane protein
MKIISTFIVLVFALSSNAQQDFLTTQFWNTNSHINPATSGLEYDHFGVVIYRRQWDNVNEAPEDIIANYSTVLGRHLRSEPLKSRHGLGATFNQSSIGFTRSTQLNLNYNYQITLGTRKGAAQRLSIGVSAGLIQLKMEPEWVPPTTLNDASLPTVFSDLQPNFNAGIAYKGKSLFAGIGITHVSATPFTSSDPLNPVRYDNARHYYAMGAYSFILGEAGKFELKPQAIVRTDAVKTSGDINLLASYTIAEKQRIWIGAGYRTSDAIAFMAGWDIFKRYRIGYSYDYSVNKLSSISYGSHEIVLGFMLNYKPRQSKTYFPNPPSEI